MNVIIVAQENSILEFKKPNLIYQGSLKIIARNLWLQYGRKLLCEKYGDYIVKQSIVISSKPEGQNLDYLIFDHSDFIKPYFIDELNKEYASVSDKLKIFC